MCGLAWRWPISLSVMGTAEPGTRPITLRAMFVEELRARREQMGLLQREFAEKALRRRPPRRNPATPRAAATRTPASPRTPVDGYQVLAHQGSGCSTGWPNAASAPGWRRTSTRRSWPSPARRQR